MRNYDADPSTELADILTSKTKFHRVDFVAQQLKSSPDVVQDVLPEPVFPQNITIVEFPESSLEPKKPKGYVLPPDYNGAYGGDWYINGKNTGPLKNRGKKSHAGDYMRGKDGRMRFVERGRQ